MVAFLQGWTKVSLRIFEYQPSFHNNLYFHCALCVSSDPLSISQEKEKDNDSFCIAMNPDPTTKSAMHETSGRYVKRKHADRMCIFLSRASCLLGHHDGCVSVAALPMLCCYSTKEFDLISLMSTTKLSTEHHPQEASISVFVWPRCGV